MEPDVRMEQRECADDFLDRRDLRGVALEKFQARRHVREQVPHLDHDTGQQGPGSLLGELAGADAKSCAGARALDVSDRGDAGERFAAKSE